MSAGELTLDEKTRCLIEKRVHESVGHISMPDCSGTGFRVGTKYFMSAYHVFREQISKMTSHIAWSLRNRESTSEEETIKEVAAALEVKRTTETVSFLDRMRRMLNDHLAEHGTNVKLLLDCLEKVIATDPIAEYFTTEIWKTCIVEFSTGKKYDIDWNIQFGDEAHDVIIVELKKQFPEDPSFPPALLIDYIHRPEEDIQIIRYKMEDIFDQDQFKEISQNQIIVSNKCDLFCKNFKEVRQKCIDWWKNWKEISNYVKDKTIDFQSHFEKDCPSQYDKTTGVLITQASRSFREGSSGSPMMYFNNSIGQPVVTSVYQGGLPKFYYDEFKRKDRDGDAGRICGEYLFNKGLSMEKLCELLHGYRKEDLKENILDPLKLVEDKHSKNPRRREPTAIMKMTVEAWRRESENCFVTRGVKETQERILSKSCVCVTGDPGSGKSMAIRRAAIRLMEEEHFTVYPISCPEDFFEYLDFDSKKSQVFVIDDILGIHSVYKQLLDQWSKYNVAIKCLLGNEKKIMASLRTGLAKGQNVRLEDFVFLEKSNRVDLSDEFGLDKKEMKSMLMAKLNANKIENGEEIVAKIWGMSDHEGKGPHISDSFPLLCNMFCKDDRFRRDPKTFFGDPLPALFRKFSNMKHEERPLLFCGLILCAAFDGYLLGDYLSVFADLDDEIVQKRNCLVRSFGLSPSSDLGNIKSAMTDNNGLYVKRLGNDFKFSHRTFNDMVTFVYDDKCFLFKYGTNQLIKDRVRLRKQKDDDPYVVLCDGDKNIQRLAKRLTDDFKKTVVDSSKSELEGASFIIENPNIDDDRLIRHLRTNLEKGDVDINILFKYCFIVLQRGYDNLEQSHDGDVIIPQFKLIKLLLELGADCNMNIGASRPLHISVNACSMQLTRLLLDKGADMRICDQQTWSVLHLACSRFSKLPFVKLFIQKGIDKISALRVLGIVKQKQEMIWISQVMRPDSVWKLEEVTPDGPVEIPTNDWGLAMKTYSGTKTLQLVEILHGSLLNSIIKRDGQNALHLAVKKGTASDVRELLALGPILTCKNNPDYQQRTPQSLLDDDDPIDDRKEKLQLFRQFDAYS